MPAPGFENAPVGDEFMEWLNVHFIEPSSEEGDQLSALDRPWEDENFWPYLTRYRVPRPCARFPTELFPSQDNITRINQSFCLLP
jgi:hypothetical protein